MLATFIWAIRFVFPAALRERDRLAWTCAVLTAAMALLAWLIVGVRVRAVSG